MDTQQAVRWRSPVTARLRLTPAGPADLATMAPLHADERVWHHFPGGRHTDDEQTRVYLVERERQWQRDGLGYWVARLLAPMAGLTGGHVVGIGGCAVPAGASWWNLYYRLTPEVHGHGLATELCQISIEAAHLTAPDRPVVAYLLERNPASKATAQRAGLTLAWRGPDAGNPDPAAVRLVYADRPLDEERLHALSGVS